MQNTLLTWSYPICTKTWHVKTLKNVNNTKTEQQKPSPVAYHPCCTATPPIWWILLSSLGPCAPLGHGWRSVSAVLVSLLDMIQRKYGRIGCEKCLTQGCPCSGPGPVSSWGDILMQWQRPSPSCHCLHAKLDVLHRRLWQSVGTYDWPPLQVRDQPHQSLSYKEVKNTVCN